MDIREANAPSIIKWFNVDLHSTPNQLPSHSLGAALGVLCLLDLLQMGYPVKVK